MPDRVDKVQTSRKEWDVGEIEDNLIKTPNGWAKVYTISTTSSNDGDIKIDTKPIPPSEAPNQD